MSARVEELEGRLGPLQSERATLDATRTREDLAALAGDWLKIARSRASGSIGYVLNQHSTPDLVQAVLAEFALQDPKLGHWLVGRLDELDTAKLSAKTKATKLKKLDGTIAKVTAELREASKAEAIAAVEERFADEAA
jgi:hypothetical protein